VWKYATLLRVSGVDEVDTELDRPAEEAVRCPRIPRSLDPWEAHGAETEAAYGDLIAQIDPPGKGGQRLGLLN